MNKVFALCQRHHHQVTYTALTFHCSGTSSLADYLTLSTENIIKNQQTDQLSYHIQVNSNTFLPLATCFCYFEMYIKNCMEYKI